MSYESPRPWCPWLMPLFFVACVAMFVYTMYLNNCPAKILPSKCVFYDELGRYSFQPRSENFFLGPSTTTLRDLGGLNRNLVVEKGEAYRFFDSMWLHANVIHLLANCSAILFMGIRMEEDYGFLRIGALYLLSGFGASLLSCLKQDGTKETTISVGASGALFGLLGSSVSEIIANWTMYQNKCCALMSLIFIIGINFAIGLIPGVDNTAHMGGFVAGFFLGFVLLLRPQYGYVSKRYIFPEYYDDHKRKVSKYHCYQQFFCVVAFVILLLGYLVGLAKLYRGETIEVQIPSFNIAHKFPEVGITSLKNSTSI